MNLSTPESIQVLPVNGMEEEHRSRSRRGIHIYLSRYLNDFNNLSIFNKQEHLSRTLGYVFQIDAEDVDSVDSSINMVTHRDAMKLAFYNWSNVLSMEIKAAWKDRADVLNSLPIPGEFVEVPRDIGGTFDVLTKHVLKSLSIEWSNVFKWFKRCVTRKPKVLTSSNIYVFGKERVRIDSQTYRTFSLSFLLGVSIFGEEYCNFYEYETIMRTKKLILFHISSQRRMRDLFAVENQYATEHNVQGVKKTCCGKVNMKDTEGRNILGYILDETARRWKIILENNKQIWIDRITYNIEENRYLYASQRDRECQWSITEYWPIRILINLNGNFKITFNRIAIDNNTQQIIPQFTS